MAARRIRSILASLFWRRTPAKEALLPPERDEAELDRMIEHSQIPFVGGQWRRPRDEDEP